MKIFTLNLSCFLLMIIFCSCEPETENLQSTTNEVTTVEFGGKELYVEKTPEGLLHQGDILISKTSPVKIYNEGETPKSTGRTSGLWPDNIVYYEVDPNLDWKERIPQAIAHWEERTNLTFKKRTNEKAYIYFTPGRGCSSYIGRTGGKQSIILSAGCSVGSTIHEIGHAVGLWHEQSRADRDKYITVHEENIKSGAEHNFYSYEEYNIPSAEFTQELDFSSIMLYGSNSFSKNGLPTMTKKNGETFGRQRDGLSPGDTEGINKMYPQSGEPEYVNGEFYTIYGLTVLRMDNRWHYPHFRFGYREVYEKNGYWFWK